MKKLLKPTFLPAVTVVLGCVGLLIRRLLYAVAVDVKNLLPVNHPLEIALWILSALAGLWIIASVWKLDGSQEYEDNFAPSLPAAVGHYVAAVGVLLSLLPQYASGRLVPVRTVLGLLAAAGLIAAGYGRQMGKRPLFLFHLAPCVFLVMHMLGNYGIWSSNPQLQDYGFDLMCCVFAVLFSFHEASFDAGMGKRRMQIGTGLLTAYFGLVAVSSSACLPLYFGCALWAVTDLCALTPRQKEETP